MNDPDRYVHWFRRSSPYIYSHRGRTFVILVEGGVVARDEFTHLVGDIALLHALGIRVVVVHGARPQIDQRLAEAGVTARYEGDLRVTPAAHLPWVMEAVGRVRALWEGRFSMGMAHSPMAGARLRVAGGNFVIARPVGVRGGVDFEHTGEVRRVDGEALVRALDEGQVVLLSPLGYSPTGEVFNLRAEEVATATAVALKADKYLCLTEAPLPSDDDGRPIAQMGLEEATRWLEAAHGTADTRRHLRAALYACRHGVQRAHLLDQHRDGALLLELFTHEGAGTLVTGEPLESIRRATIDDIGGILALIEPLEAAGVLVRRSRERLEQEIDHFLLAEVDGRLIACAALYPDDEHRMGELACLAVDPEFRRQGWADRLLRTVVRQAREAGLERLFVLTTQAEHWFRERGFQPARVEDLPRERQALYNWQRNSKVFIKTLV